MPLAAFGDGPHHGVGEGLPAASGVRGRLVCAHGQHRVEQQHALLGPAVEVARGGTGVPVSSDTSLKMFWSEGKGHAVADREAESVGLPGPW